MKTILLLMFILAIQAFNVNANEAYIVKKGDTLSDLAFQYLGKKVYGNRGTLIVLLNLNGHIKKVDKIYPGMQIFMPKRATQKENDLDQNNYRETSSAPLQASEINPCAEVDVIEEKQGSVNIAAEYRVTTLEATDNTNNSKAYLRTNYDLVTKASGSIFVYDSLKGEAGVLARFLNFAESNNSTRGLSNRSQIVPGVFLNFSKNINSKLDLNAIFEYKGQIFLKSLTSNTVGVDAVNVPSYSVGANYFLKKNFSISGQVAIIGKGSTDNYTINQGQQLKMGIKFFPVLFKDNKSTTFGFDVQKRSQKTSTSKIDETSYGFELGYKF